MIRAILLAGVATTLTGYGLASAQPAGYASVQSNDPFADYEQATQAAASHGGNADQVSHTTSAEDQAAYQAYLASMEQSPSAEPVVADTQVAYQSAEDYYAATQAGSVQETSHAASYAATSAAATYDVASQSHATQSAYVDQGSTHAEAVEFAPAASAEAAAYAEVAQGYSDQGYTDQGYSDQGYSDQAHVEQTVAADIPGMSGYAAAGYQVAPASAPIAGYGHTAIGAIHSAHVKTHGQTHGPVGQKMIKSRVKVHDRISVIGQIDNETDFAPAKKFVTAALVEAGAGETIEFDGLLPEPTDLLTTNSTRGAIVATVAQHIVSGFDKECIRMKVPVTKKTGYGEASGGWGSEPEYKTKLKCITKWRDPFERLSYDSYHVGVFGAGTYVKKSFEDQDGLTAERKKLGGTSIGGDILAQAGAIITTDISRFQIDAAYRYNELNFDNLLARALEVEDYYGATEEEPITDKIEVGAQYAHRFALLAEDPAMKFKRAKHGLKTTSIEADLLPYLGARWSNGSPTGTVGAQVRFGQNIALNYSSLNSIKNRQIGYSLADKTSWYGFLGAQADHDFTLPHTTNEFYEHIGLTEAFEAGYSQTRFTASAGLGITYNNIDLAARADYTLPSDLDYERAEYTVGLKASFKF